MMLNMIGPIWQDISPGQRVRPKRGRRLGEVISITEYTDPRFTDPIVSTTVVVVWNNDPNGMETWATDCLEVVA